MPPGEIEIRSPWSGEVVGTVRTAAPEDIERAIAAAVRAFPRLRDLPAYEREAILARTSALIQARREDLARTIALESGKPIREARVEVGRAVVTFRTGAEEAKRVGGETIPLDIVERARGRLGITRRVPRGPIAAITPFNFPLNLVAHKVAPAIACGCPVVLKPAPQTPLTALALAGILAEAGLPEGALAVLPGGADVGTALVEDERLKLVSFTGSDRAGWEIKRRAGKKPVLLELGGNAAAIVCAGADIDAAAAKCVAGAFTYAGQSCISVQRMYVEAAVYRPFVERFVERARALVLGDPLREETDCGPLIDESSVARMAEWTAEALERGARVACGGRRWEGHARVFEPTLLEDAPEDARIVARESFGPVRVARSFERFEDALALANAGEYGLQAGIFTRDLGRALAAFRTLEVGAVVVDDVPTFRVDHMPYGGTKSSGLGREGVRYAIEEMTETRMLILPAG